MAQIKLILLDFDGTLVDTRMANGNAYIEALGELGIELTMEDYLNKYFGMHCMAFMSKIGVDSPEVARRVRRRKVEIYPQYFDSITLNEPLWQWCMMMRTMGAKVYIVSTGHIDNIHNVMRYLNIESGIDAIISGDDVARPKPYPDGFLKAMSEAGVAPEETIIFEDSEFGLEAAKQSGAPYVKISMKS